jgi:hypothetical protein
MVATAAMPIGFMMLLLSGVGTDMLGLPPGERDAAYLQAAPGDSLLYFEWASRGQGVPDGQGIDGLVADPEVQYFFAQLKSAILETVERESSRSNRQEEQVLGEHLPPLIEHLIGHSGCVYFTFSNPTKTEPGEERGPPPGKDAAFALVSGAKLTVIFDGGEKADETEQHLIELLKLIPEGDGPGDKLNRYEIPLPLPGMKVFVHREKNHFVFTSCTDESALNRAIAGLKGEVKGLGESEGFQQQFAHVKMERIGSVAYVDIAKIRDTALELAGPFGAIAKSMIDTAGASKVDALISIAGVIDGQIAHRTHLQTGGSTTGLFALTAGRGLKAEDFAAIPGDADFVASFSLDFPGVLKAVEQVIATVEPSLSENADAMKEMFAQQAGFDLEKDLLPAYGQHWCLFDSPDAGGLYVTSLTLAVEVKDPKKAQEVFGKIIKVLQSQLPGDFSTEYRRRGVTLESREFLDHTIHFVNTVGDDVPIAPAFCQTDKQLLIALHPQAFKAHLRFLKEKAPSLASSMSEHAPKTGEMICFSQFDAPQLIRFVYSVMPYLMQVGLSEAQSENFNLDIFSVPSAQAIFPYMKDSRSWIVRTNEGLLFESRSSLPMPPVAALLMSTWMLGRSANATFQDVAPAAVDRAF